MTSPPPLPRRPLVVTSDDLLLDEVLQLAVAAGVEVDVAPDVWAAGVGQAPHVVLGADVVGSTRPESLAADARVLMVSRHPPSAAVEAAAASWKAVAVVLPSPAAEREVLALLTATAARPLAPVIAVLGACGGAGATTLAAALAVTAAKHGGDVVLVDGDPHGCGIDLAFGAEHAPGLRWPDLVQIRAPLAADALHDVLPRAHGVALVSHGREGLVRPSLETLEEVISAAARRARIVVVDVGRSGEGSAAVVAGLASRAYVVLPAEVRAVAAAARLAGRTGELTRATQLVVRRTSASTVPTDAVARLLALPVAGELRPEPGLSAAYDRGDPPAIRGRGPLASLCRRLLEDLPSVGADRGAAA